ncbi:MAG: hypothetical protein E2O68_07810 [Deltaproteobacteria bacterium]|nr:MAG: hypothetical protein E2O68_07810 [Deltaproteobacteria bacterium]
MKLLILIPIILQGFSFFIDEFYYHHKRGLPKWEVIGHPLDTLTVMSVYAFAALTTFSTTNLYIFLALGIFSSLFITKDEFVHSELCSAGEDWLHSILFVLHPMVFFSIGYLWYTNDKMIIWGQLILTISLLLYQIIYWGFYATGNKQRSLS